MSEQGSATEHFDRLELAISTALDSHEKNLLPLIADLQSQVSRLEGELVRYRRVLETIRDWDKPPPSWPALQETARLALTEDGQG
jgi:hypothetical protein